MFINGDFKVIWFNPWLVQSVCQSVLGLDTELRVALNVFIGLWELNRKSLDVDKSATWMAEGDML